MANQEARRDAVEEVMTAVMSGKIGAIARHFYPGAVVSQRSNAALSGEPWFERMEGEFQLRGEGETRAFIEELLKRSSYLTFELRGVICEGGEAASRCDWSRRDDNSGALLTGTTMYWFGFTGDDRIRTLETLGAIHSVIPMKRAQNDA